MFGNEVHKSQLADRRRARRALIRRLLTEQAFGQWRRYAVAFVLMGVAARRTALGAYLIGDVINAAYVDKNLPASSSLAMVTAVIFLVKAIATYGQAVMLARIGNRIIALNQRRMFDALISRTSRFFSERHSSEFMARLTTGAAAASQVINLLVTAIGRDLLSLIGLVAVMVVQDPMMSLFTLRRGAAGACDAAQDDPPHLQRSRATSSPAARASSKPCRRRCRASASSRPTRSKR